MSPKEIVPLRIFGTSTDKKSLPQIINTRSSKTIARPKVSKSVYNLSLLYNGLNKKISRNPDMKAINIGMIINAIQNQENILLTKIE